MFYPRRFMLLNVFTNMLDRVHMQSRMFSNNIPVIDDVITSGILLFSAQLTVPGRAKAYPFLDPRLGSPWGLSNP